MPVTEGRLRDPRGGGLAVSRRQALALLALPLLGCGRGPVSRGARRSARRAIDRGVEWLRAAQSPDGLFRSTKYGLLKGGHSLTPFLADALMDSIPAVRPAGMVERALAALPALQQNGALGFGGLAPDYPTYATGLALKAWSRARLEGEAADAAMTWLLAQQLTAERGWANHPGQGAWAMGSPVPPTPPRAGHVDLSMTRRVLEGLAAAGARAEHLPLQEARAFIERCQAPGGGFVYSPVELALNKGGCEQGACVGYGSATTDGLLAALAAGVPKGDPLIQRNLAYLLDLHVLDRNPGIPPGPLQGFSKAMVGYYRAGSAAVFARLGGPEGWRSGLIEAVVADQREDGSWLNPDPLQKEDEPLISTGFALSALGSALK